MRGLDPPARPKPLRRGEGPRIHASSQESFRSGWIAGSSRAMTDRGRRTSVLRNGLRGVLAAVRRVGVGAACAGLRQEWVAVAGAADAGRHRLALLDRCVCAGAHAGYRILTAIVA